MTDIQFKTSEQWLKELENQLSLKTLDGWDKENLSYSFFRQEISKAEFIQRALKSGVNWHVEKL